MLYLNRNGSTSVVKREKVIALWSSGSSQSAIASDLKLSNQTVSKIISNFIERGTPLPRIPGGKERTVSTPEVAEFVEYAKITKPSSYATEIQQAI